MRKPFFIEAFDAKRRAFLRTLTATTAALATARCGGGSSDSKTASPVAGVGGTPATGDAVLESLLPPPHLAVASAAVVAVSVRRNARRLASNASMKNGLRMVTSVQPHEPGVCGVARHIDRSAQPRDVEELVVRAALRAGHRAATSGGKRRHLDCRGVDLVDGAARTGEANQVAIHRRDIDHRRLSGARDIGG